MITRLRNALGLATKPAAPPALRFDRPRVWFQSDDWARAGVRDREGINTGPALFKRGFCQAVVQFPPAYRYPLERRLCSILDFVTKLREARKDRAQ